MVEVMDVDIIAARELLANIAKRRFDASRAAGDFEKAVLEEAESLGEYALTRDTRTYCILVTSFAEDVLRQNFVERWGIDTPAKTAEFFGSNGPLNTLAQRMTIASGLGWLPEVLVAGGSLLRKIRNEFAHNYRVHSLSQDPVRSWASELQPFEKVWINDERTAYRDAYEKADRETHLRMRVFTTAIHVVAQILARAKIVAHELPAGYREEGYFGLTDVEQGLIDIMIRHCYASMGLTPKGEPLISE